MADAQGTKWLLLGEQRQGAPPPEWPSSSTRTWQLTPPDSPAPVAPSDVTSWRLTRDDFFCPSTRSDSVAVGYSAHDNDGGGESGAGGEGLDAHTIRECERVKSRREIHNVRSDTDRRWGDRRRP